MDTRTLAPGAVVGSFVIERFLAAGGMGAVYRARQQRLNRDVALKVLNVQVAAGSESAARFHSEALAMARLEHPNIVAVYDAGESNGAYFIAMQFVAGGTLQTVLDRLQRRKSFLPMSNVLEIMRQVCNALAYAHERGLVHRDIKPSNILCESERRFLLTDFGIALDLRRGERTEGKSGTGTVTYMSPEQARGDPLDARSDIYSLGVLLYCLLTNRPPFDDANPLTVMYQHANEAPPPVENLRADVPAEVVRVLRRCMAKKPEDRYTAVSEVIAALPGQAAAAGASGSRRPLVVALVIAAAVVVAILAAALSTTSETADGPAVEPEPSAAVPATRSQVRPPTVRVAGEAAVATVEASPTSVRAAPTPTIAPTARPTRRPVATSTSEAMWPPVLNSPLPAP